MPPGLTSSYGGAAFFKWCEEVSLFRFFLRNTSSMLFAHASPVLTIRKGLAVFMPAKRTITVVGGGVIGLTTAYALIQAGHGVTLVEREDHVGEQASFGNGGQLSYRYVRPSGGCRGAAGGAFMDVPCRIPFH